MTEPLRVVVAGSSVVSYLSPPRALRSEGTYGELLGPALRARGIESEIRTRSIWLGLVRDLRKEYERAIRDQMPDVVVIHIGHVDCQPNMLPTWLVRHVANWNRSGANAARAYRRFVSDRAWPLLRAYQQRMSGLPTYRVRPRAFRYELTRLIALIRLETRALVLVLDIDPPGSRQTHWMPGLGERRDAYQGILEEVVDRFGADVRLVRGSATLDGRLEALLGDGLHRSAEGHRLLAELLADDIATWTHEEDGPAKDDPHRWV